MIDVVYPLGKGSIYNNFELRMSLRSIEAHLSNYRNVYIIGERPSWITNVTHIPAKDPTKCADYNIMRKIEVACRNQQVSDDFLFMNDDHYLLTGFNAAKFPYVFSKTTDEYMRIRKPDGYRRQVQNTHKYLRDRGLPTRFFDCHYPILYNKALFLEHVVDKLNWNGQAYVLKSIYANSLRVEGRLMPDHKGNQIPPADAAVFSTTPHIRTNIQRFLCDKFKRKSKFEMDKPGF